jgi:DNA-binding winged helix-turn-helix (wHTH) protein
MPVGEKQTYRFGLFELDTQCGELRRDGVGLKLQGQPVQILEILLEKTGQLVTREELRERLWASHTFVDFDHSLNTAIKKLRQALGDEADTPRYIQTLRGRGYRFVGEVSAEHGLCRARAAGPPSAEEDIVSKVVATLADATITAEATLRIRSRRHLGIAFFLLLLACIGVLGYWITKPAPAPHVVGLRALTKTGYPKDFLNKPLSDRRALYFFEKRPTGWITLQVPLAGGDAFEFHSVGWLSDISNDGLQLLSAMGKAEPPMTSLDKSPTDTWVQTLANRSSAIGHQELGLANVVWSKFDPVFPKRSLRTLSCNSGRNWTRKACCRTPHACPSCVARWTAPPLRRRTTIHTSVGTRRRQARTPTSVSRSKTGDGRELDSRWKVVLLYALGWRAMEYLGGFGGSALVEEEGACPTDYIWSAFNWHTDSERERHATLCCGQAIPRPTVCLRPRAEDIPPSLTSKAYLLVTRISVAMESGSLMCPTQRAHSGGAESMGANAGS